MQEYLHISFSPHIDDFETYFTTYDNDRFKGELTEGIKSGDYIWIEKRALIGKKRLEVYEKWVNNFKDLIDMHVIPLQFNPEKLRNAIKTANPFYPFKQLDSLDVENKYGFDEITQFFIKVLEQPLYYLEVMDETNNIDNINQKNYTQYNSLRKKISVAKDQFSNNLFYFRNDLTNQLRKEPNKISILLKELILATEHFLINTYKHSIEFSFNYERSPLFYEYMVFMKDVKCYLRFLDSNGELPLLNKYLENIDDYKKPFQIDRILPHETIKVGIPKKEITLPGMFSDQSKLQYICSKLLEKEFILKSKGGKYNWKGDPLKTYGNGKGLQLVALSLWCEKFYNETYNCKQIHKSFTSFFNSGIKDTNFKDSMTGNAIKYKPLFSFIKSI